MRLTLPVLASIVVLGVTFMGCQSSRRQLLAADESQVRLRSIQTRAFDTTDKMGTLRTVMATMQDLGFVIDNADDVIGTVRVRPRGETQLLVRASAQYNLRAVEDPEPYQQFFEALSKSMFLAAHEVD